MTQVGRNDPSSPEQLRDDGVDDRVVVVVVVHVDDDDELAVDHRELVRNVGITRHVDGREIQAPGQLTDSEFFMHALAH